MAKSERMRSRSRSCPASPRSLSTAPPSLCPPVSKPSGERGASSAASSDTPIDGMMSFMILPLLFFLAFTADDSAALLPDGPGKEAVGKICTECHDTANIRKLRLPRDGWSEKIDDMVDRGAKGSDQEMMAVLDYLTKNFGPDSKLYVNTAPFGEIKTILGLTNDETQAILDYRQKNGNFQQWKDLLKVAGVEGKKIEAKKDLLAF